MNTSNIPEHKYAIYYWLTLENFNREEWERFIQDLSPFTKLFTIDGIDEECQSLCFKFSRFVPKDKSQIKICKEKNLIYKKEFLKALREDIRGRVYFNVNRGVLKKII